MCLLDKLERARRSTINGYSVCCSSKFLGKSN
jgi:hypothetical protein